MTCIGLEQMYGRFLWESDPIPFSHQKVFAIYSNASDHFTKDKIVVFISGWAPAFMWKPCLRTSFKMALWYQQLHKETLSNTRAT